jgi:hypothetical protein
MEKKSCLMEKDTQYPYAMNLSVQLTLINPADYISSYTIVRREKN